MAIRSLALVAVAALVAGLTVAAPAHGYGPNETTDWINVAEPVGDVEVLPQPVNKRGKPNFITDQDLTLSDLDGDVVSYVRDDANYHNFSFSLREAVPAKADYPSKRTVQWVTIKVFGDGEPLILFNYVPEGAGVSDLRYQYQEWFHPDAPPISNNRCNEGYGVDPSVHLMIFAIRTECVPADVEQLTRMEFTSETRVYNKNNAYRVRSGDTALIDTPVPAHDEPAQALTEPETAERASSKPKFLRPEKVLFKGYTCTDTDDPSVHVVTWKWRAVGGQYAHLGTSDGPADKVTYTYPDDVRKIRNRTKLTADESSDGYYEMTAEYIQLITRIGNKDDYSKSVVDKQTLKVNVDCWD